MEFDMKSIRDICREAKERAGKTSKDIADATGLSVATVHSFFSRPSKSPSFYTVALICVSLGIDLNEVCGIVPVETAETKMKQMEAGREKDIQIAHLEGRMEEMERNSADAAKQLTRQRKYSIALSIICAVLMAVVIGYVSFDASIRNAGLIQNGNVSIYVVIIFGVMLLALAIMGKLMVGIIRDFSPPPPCVRGDNKASK